MSVYNNLAWIIILMGICYSEQQQWQAYKQTRHNKNRRKKRPKNASIIYEEKSVYQSSFSSQIHSSFREDVHNALSQLALEQGSVFVGSIAEMREEELQILYKSLYKFNVHGQPHAFETPIILSNLKTKNYLHTHKIKIPQCKTLNEISCCPYNSNHITEYDIWKFIQAPKSEVSTNESLDSNSQHHSANVYIYHPFTERYLNYERGCVVGSEKSKVWRINSFGMRRNGGFIKIECESGELCMCEQKGLLERHRKVQMCKQKHVSHIWEIMFIEDELK